MERVTGDRPLRVLTWNLWWRFGPWRKRREAIVSELRRMRPDVCGLQEVWMDGEENLAASIAEDLGMRFVYAPSPAPEKWQRRIGNDSMGVGCAVLSRWPITESDVRRLPTGDEPDEPFPHLNASGEFRRASWRRFARIFVPPVTLALLAILIVLRPHSRRARASFRC